MCLLERYDDTCGGEVRGERSFRESTVTTGFGDQSPATNTHIIRTHQTVPNENEHLMTYKSNRSATSDSTRISSHSSVTLSLNANLFLYTSVTCVTHKLCSTKIPHCATHTNIDVTKVVFHRYRVTNLLH